MEAGELSSDDEVILISPKHTILVSESDEMDPLNIQPPPAQSRKHKHRRKDSKKHSDKGHGREFERGDERWNKQHNMKLGELERERHRLEREHRHEERRLQHKRHTREGQRSDPRSREQRPHSNRPREDRPRIERTDRKYGEDRSLETKRRRLDREINRRSGDKPHRHAPKKMELPRVDIAPPTDIFEIIPKDPAIPSEFLDPPENASDSSLTSVEDPEVEIAPEDLDDEHIEDLHEMEYEDMRSLDQLEDADSDHLKELVVKAYKEMKDIPKLYSDEESPEIQQTPIATALFQAKSKFDDPEEEDEDKLLQILLDDNPRSSSKDKDSTIDESRSLNSDSISEVSNEEQIQEVIKSPVAVPAIVKLPSYFPAIQGCRSVEEFNCLNRIEEGTYGVVYRAKDKKTDEIVALKRLKMEKEKEGFPITSLREINTLLKAQHINIVHVREIVVGSNMDKIFIVMDYVEHDMKCLMESMKEPFMIGEVKTLMLQLLRGVAHMHDNWIIHRDLKTSNLLLSHKGILKIGDFGLAREYGAPLRHYTPIVVTLWYRAPELLLGTKLYSTPIDLWSVGVIFAEFLTRKPLFPAKTDIDAINKIFKELGTPTNEIWKGVSDLPGMKKCTFAEHPYNQLKNRFGSTLSSTGFNLMNAFLTYDPEKRVSAVDALKHAYFREVPHPIDPSMFPTWPAKSEHGNKPKKDRTPKPPSGGQAYNKLMAEDKYEGFSLNKIIANSSSKGAGFALKF